MIAPYAEQRREQVVLWRADGITFRQIAEVIDLSAGRVRQLESKGLREIERGGWFDRLRRKRYQRGGR